MPLDSTHLVNINTVPGAGGHYNNNSLSRSWFLILNKSNVYSAFIMTVIADSGYIKGDYRKLKHNTYQQRDNYFSGILLYSTPTGKLIKGWQYKNGKIVHTLSTGTTTSNRVNVQSIGGGLKTEAFACTDWYADYYVNDAYILSVFLGTTCADDGSGTPADHNPDGDGGSGSFPPPDAGGGGSSSSSTSLLFTITDTSLKKNFPCATKLIIDSLLKDTGYAKLVAPFMTSSIPNLNWRDSSMTWNATTTMGAHTYQLGETRHKDISINSTVFLNTKMLQNSSQLMIASTAIHESLHAIMNYDLQMMGYAINDEKVDSTSWMVGIDSWYALNGLPSNFSNHFDMMDYYFAKAVSVLATWDKNGHTAKEYEMAMLYGLNNPGSTTGAGAATPSQIAALNTEYNSLMTKYGITSADLSTFYTAELNAPTAKKLPTSGCN